MSRRIRPVLPFVIALILLGLTACEETVDPILESDRNFTLFGTLDLARDTQYVRVIPIRETLEQDTTRTLDIEFETIDLNSGERRVWRDSLVRFEDGSIGHVFYTPLRLRDGHTYRVEIESAELDVTTWAETTVPYVPTVLVYPEMTSAGPFGPARIEQQIVWLGVAEEPFRIDQYYRFLLSVRGIYRDVHLPVEPSVELTDQGVMNVLLDLRRDKAVLDTLLDTDSSPLAGLGMQLTMLDPAFNPPEGRFDPEILVQPGTMSNVENGFGFVGSVGRFSVEWLLNRTTIDQLGYMTIEELFARSGSEAEVEVLPFEWSAIDGARTIARNQPGSAPDP